VLKKRKIRSQIQKKSNRIQKTSRYPKKRTPRGREKENDLRRVCGNRKRRQGRCKGTEREKMKETLTLYTPTRPVR
jgi:hypothetical protein